MYFTVSLLRCIEYRAFQKMYTMPCIRSAPRSYTTPRVAELSVHPPVCVAHTERVVTTPTHRAQRRHTAHGARRERGPESLCEPSRRASRSTRHIATFPTFASREVPKNACISCDRHPTIRHNHATRTTQVSIARTRCTTPTTCSQWKFHLSAVQYEHTVRVVNHRCVYSRAATQMPVYGGSASAGVFSVQSSSRPARCVSRGGSTGSMGELRPLPLTGAPRSWSITGLMSRCRGIIRR